MKRFLAASVVLCLLMFMVTASASTSGTSSDPLITLSYLSGPFSESLKTDISKTADNIAENAGNKLDELFGRFADYNFASGFTRISLATGDSVILSTGSSLIVSSGTAAITVASGEVINISSGSETSSGSRLSQDQRYFCTENTIAIITAETPLIGLVDGFYHIEVVAPNRPHPVFRDVLELDWFYEAIDFVYNHNLFGGTAPDAFSPSDYMTRGMFVTVLFRLEGAPDTGFDAQFTDVMNTSIYYYQAVKWANENRIVEGYEDGTFRPDDSVTREQMAAIMYRYANYKNHDMSAAGSVFSSFPDSGDVSGYAVDAMQWVVSRGVINGSNGRLLPRDTASRAQVAQIIYNYIKNVG